LDEPYHCSSLELGVLDTDDDAEDRVTEGDNTIIVNDDLDLGSYLYNSVTDTQTYPDYVGIRFQNVPLSKKTKIINAYIEFEAYDDSDSPPEKTRFTFRAEATDHAESYKNEKDNLHFRPKTTNSVVWENVPSWTANNIYQSPDLSPIIQEVLDRDGWNPGQAIAIIINGEGHREVKSRNYQGYKHSPKLYISFEGECKEYYGYFDPTSRYSYSNSIFSRDPAGEWSGNFLNWLTMRRIDVARKVLIGGLANPRTYAGTQKLSGHNAPSNRTYFKSYDGSSKYIGIGGSIVTPYNDGVYNYEVDGGEFKVYDSKNSYKDTYKIVVEKVADDEPEDFAEIL
jgi:type IV pilus assembly protein PilY1